MSHWKTIDTAPKDGTPLLLANFFSACQLTGIPHVWAGRYDKFEECEEPMLLGCSYAAINENGTPTHWCEMPNIEKSDQDKVNKLLEARSQKIRDEIAALTDKPRW